MASTWSSSRMNRSPPQASQMPSLAGGMKVAWKFWPQPLHTRRPERRSTTPSSAMSKFTTASTAAMPSSASAWGMVRGNPSRIKPLATSSWDKRSFTSSMVRSSLTKAPESIIAFTFTPRGVWFLMAARKMSPVEMWGMPYSVATFAARVPFPAPGGPRKMQFIITSK